MSAQLKLSLLEFNTSPDDCERRDNGRLRWHKRVSRLYGWHAVQSTASVESCRRLSEQSPHPRKCSSLTKAGPMCSRLASHKLTAGWALLHLLMFIWV